MMMQNTHLFRKAIVDHFIDPAGGNYKGMTRSLLGFYHKDYTTGKVHYPAHVDPESWY